MSTGPSNSTSASANPPSGRKPRKLVLCFDGTADSYDDTVTNVVKLYSLLKKDQVEDQLCYYQPGIGTYFPPGFVTPIFRWIAKTMDKAIAWYIYQHVIDGYKFLMQNYVVGDTVCLFGFSRGAYIARALAGMLYKVGLLSEDNTEQIAFAYNLYESNKKSDEDLVPGFRETFCRPVPIDFVGVWDTVSSVGIWGKTLPFVDGSDMTIREFRQALSINENRAKFSPNLYRYHRGDDGEETGVESEKWDKKWDELHLQKTNVLEMWFAGCHADVGGGNSRNEEIRALSNIPLRWMIEQIVQAGAPILFDDKAFDRWDIPLSIKHHQTSETRVVGSTNEDVLALDALDAVQPITNQMSKVPLWLILEFLPSFYPHRDAEGKWHIHRQELHLGEARDVPQDRWTLTHWTVELRKDLKVKYGPEVPMRRTVELPKDWELKHKPALPRTRRCSVDKKKKV